VQAQLNDKFQNGDARFLLPLSLIFHFFMFREILEHGKKVFTEQKEAEKEKRLKLEYTSFFSSSQKITFFLRTILKLEPKCMSGEAGEDAYEAAETCLSLVDLYRQGGISTRNDWYRISTWLQRACDLGFLDGCSI